MHLGEDTIAAIATGAGEGGVGIVRISGGQAVDVGNRVFRPNSGPGLAHRRSHSVTYGWVVDQSREVVDESLAIVMRGPRSFTGEDVVELQCHGGQVAVKRVLSSVLSAGARLAEPGEFTRRAFLNGRMDLSQAESVVDIIRAKTDRAMAAAVGQLRGGLTEKVRLLRDRLLEVAAHLEADIDFPELDLEVQTQNDVVLACAWCIEQVKELLGGAKQGRLLREGFRVVLAGRPNVGKSSLLNRLVRENRAIVTAVPGTTRDVIEEWINIQGMPVIVTDTAGIRETTDVVEQLGVDRSRAMLDRADLVLLVADAAVGVTREDEALASLLPRETERILVVNKADLLGADKEVGRGGLADMRLQLVSAASGAGLSSLEHLIASVAGYSDREESLVANARQEEALRKTLHHLESALQTRSAGFGSDLLSIDVRGAWEALGDITGECVGEDLLDQIFSRFCIGK